MKKVSEPPIDASIDTTTLAPGEEGVLQLLDRLEKLSRRPENPGLAYRNLETINALINNLREKLGHLPEA